MDSNGDIFISREEMELLYKKGGRSKQLVFALMLLPLMGICLVIRFRYDLPPQASAPVVGILIAVFACTPIAYAGFKRKNLPDGYTGLYESALEELGSDFVSDRAVNMLFAKMGQAESFPEKLMLTLLLSDIYGARGEFDEALGMLGSADRSGFMKYPTTALYYFTRAAEIYTLAEDPDSVLNILADSEPFVSEYARRSYNFCQEALTLMICAEWAKAEKALGEDNGAADECFHRALEMQMLKNIYTNRLANDDPNIRLTAYECYRRGVEYARMADICHMCGDLFNAEKYIGAAIPLLSGSPSASRRAAAVFDIIRSREMGENNA